MPAEPLPCGCYADEECSECAPWGDDAQMTAREAWREAVWFLEVSS